jgi:hypothetical protein
VKLEERTPAPNAGAVAPTSWLGRRREAVRRRWRGEVPLGQVFWDDMVLAGSAVNVATTLLAMYLFSTDVPVALAVTVFFSPLPLNCFLVAAVWRSAESAPAATALAARSAAIVWLVAATTL